MVNKPAVNKPKEALITRRSLDAYKETTPFAFGKIYLVIVVSLGNKCFNTDINDTINIRIRY